MTLALKKSTKKIPKDVLAGTKRMQLTGNPSWRHAYCSAICELFSQMYRHGFANAGTPPSKYPGQRVTIASL